MNKNHIILKVSFGSERVHYVLSGCCAPANNTPLMGAHKYGCGYENTPDGENHSWFDPSLSFSAASDQETDGTIKIIYI